MATLNVRAHAKINLSLAVLGKRTDGFHELRSVFHTISLADDIRIEWTPGPRTKVDVTANVEIPGENIATKAAPTRPFLRTNVPMTISSGVIKRSLVVKQSLCLRGNFHKNQSRTQHGYNGKRDL